MTDASSTTGGSNAAKPMDTFHTAVDKADYAQIQSVLESTDQIDLNGLRPDGMPPLIRLVSAIFEIDRNEVNLDSIRLLVTKGADVNCQVSSSGVAVR